MESVITFFSKHYILSRLYKDFFDKMHVINWGHPLNWVLFYWGEIMKSGEVKKKTVKKKDCLPLDKRFLLKYILCKLGIHSYMFTNVNVP
jgi:hypothetical protein